METANKNTLNWMLVTVLLFPVLVILGLFLRSVQANALPSQQVWFYPAMTLHGLGMVGLWFTASMACAIQALSPHIKISRIVSGLAFWGTLVGVVMLIATTLVGRFAAGWYFLYPLPLKGTWPAWSAVLFLASLTILGATWLVWALDVLRAIAKRYTIGHALGWHYIRGSSGPDVPPSVLIVTVSMIATVASLVAGVILLVLYYLEVFAGVKNDALLMKNLTFFFGHVLVNLTLYLGVAVVYEVLPVYANRPWKANKIVALSWNAVLAIVLLAYFHHLYMDFVQPALFQVIGQVSSYLSSLPAAVVTMFGALALVYRSGMKWNMASLFMFIGLMGWAIGGVGAVIDATITVNARLHNTLWVPAHFHTYMLMGVVLFVLGYFYHYVQSVTGLAERMGLQKATVALMLVGGYGFLLMFYFSGAASVPRRFAAYPSELGHGATLSAAAVAFVLLYLAGLVLYLVQAGVRWRKACA